jgi:hypothetical protein
LLAVEHRAEHLQLPVVGVEGADLVEDALVARQRADRGHRRLQEVGLRTFPRIFRRSLRVGVGLHEEQDPVHLPIGVAPEDGGERAAKRLVVQDASVDEPGRFVPVEVHVVGREAVVQILAPEQDRLEGAGKGRCGARHLGQHLRAGRALVLVRRAERLLATGPVLEVNRRAMAARRDGMFAHLGDELAAPVEVGDRQEAVQLRRLRGLELRAGRLGDRHLLESFGQLPLHVVAPEQRPGLRRVGVLQEIFDACFLAPEVGHAAELASSAQRIAEEQTIEATGGCARDHVDGGVDVGQPLEDAPDAPPADEVEVFARDSIHVDREGDAAVHHQTQADLGLRRRVGRGRVTLSTGGLCGRHRASSG